MTPCPRCGSPAVFLDDTPQCMACLQIVEKIDRFREQVEIGLVGLRVLAMTAPPSLFAEVSDDTFLWRVQIELLRFQIEAAAAA